MVITGSGTRVRRLGPRPPGARGAGSCPGRGGAYDCAVARGPELYLFDSGTLALAGVEVPVPFFLVRHPDGVVVIDGGNPLAVAQDPHAHWGGLADVFEVHMTEAQHCAAQLRELGVEAGDVTHIVQTHLHIDHTGALGHFPDAAVVVDARELEAARAAEDPMRSGYVRADYEQPGLRWQVSRAIPTSSAMGSCA